MRSTEHHTPCANRACLAPHAVDARICTTHTDQLLDALRTIVRVEDDLVTVMARQTAARHIGGGHAGGGRPMPFQWDGSDTLSALRTTLTTWARDVAASDGLTLDLDRVVVTPPPRHARSHMVVVGPRRTNRAHPMPGAPVLPTPIVNPELDEHDRPVVRRHDDPAQLPYRAGEAARAAQWLLDHPATLGMFEHVGQLADEVVHIAGSVQHVIDRAPTRWYLGLCDHCETPLYARPETRYACCRNPECVDLDGRPHVYEVAARRAWLIDAAQDYMVTAAEASRAVPALADRDTPFVYSTFRAACGVAIPADRTHPDGHPRYRLGDCIRWAEDRAKAAAESRPPPERVA